MEITFEQFIDALKVGSRTQVGMYINGPLSNGDYTIEFEGKVKMIIYPNLRQKNGQDVMDFICIPQGANYDLIHTYDITETMKAFLPSKRFLYGQSTIERSMSRTACIRFSLSQNLLKTREDVAELIRTIEFLRDNTHIILQKQVEYA
ncbi:hypothetical protein MHZ92_07995 [Sporosarcina sp. ACRSL]|uniref:hypothetical protein n=1 Tax=Sporosarcina sp. ACRSL TaxID=2918215 RepID=UPI001EF6D9C5|nr:hypothetical protein [Sporosarcina sp. ACRSL]MCG7344069.1 hypothetical protein [Sporosarcina sp. ACRSL]